MEKIFFLFWSGGGGGDCPPLAFSAACHLHDSGRSDVIYLIAKGLGTMRLDKSDSQGECQLG